MSLTRWEPISELRKMREDMDRMFENLWQPSEMPVRFAPAIDVFEKDNQIIVKAEVPGLKKDDIEVSVTEDCINLKGEFKQEEEVKEDNFYRHERKAGKFFRTIPLPSAINPDEVKASYKEGVLEIQAPKVEPEKAKEKKIAIEG